MPEREGVPDEVVEATLPFMSETIQAMTMVHRVSDMRSQDVCNLRICDIEMHDPDYSVFSQEACRTSASSMALTSRK